MHSNYHMIITIKYPLVNYQSVSENKAMTFLNSATVALRRRRLKQWIQDQHDGVQAFFVEKISINQGELSGLLNGKKSFGEKKARTIEKLAGMPDNYLDTTEEEIPEKQKSSTFNIKTGNNYIRVDHIEAEAHMGQGRINEDLPEVINSVEFPPNYIRSLIGFLPPPGRLKLITGTGNSMSPKILPGETVLVDTGCNTFVGDGLYLVNTGNGQQIKALHDRNGYIYITSMDKALYPDFVADENTIIGGRVYLIQHLERVS
ncbi:helix-turn-helix transcriptional regulator [Xylella fastidiosa subsp. multiplex]|uniref:S24 family peptidase n=2 Tax=Xylella fastidiosa TaxID=2371 RepID=UPI0003984FD7|nr:helix-turn-helix transcriptional regulator [Xylella fastidiosa]ERI59240.1 repressor [Xylella fastidiosa subsp. multiplex Griffin-1]QPB99292.1 helix-turn-helix transcriptional regulator [Xylella fastidiosa subsp. multiplex]UIT44701.1 helix-turn-helix transcriptional regulator [Xylella fastidiosa subsp. multiplex]